MNTLRVPAAVLLSALLLVWACSDDPAGPSGPADVVVEVVSPNGLEGAAVLEISGGGFSDLRLAAAGEGVLFAESTSAGEALVGVILDRGGDLRFVMTVEDAGDPPRIDVLSVAGADDRLRPSTAGYQVRIGPAEGSE